MVDRLRIVLGAAAISCMLQSLESTTISPPTTPEYETEAYVRYLIQTLQSREKRVIEELQSKLQRNYVTELSYAIKNVLEGIKAEQDTFNKNKTDLDPKYANCSEMQTDGLQTVLSESEELLWQELIKMQSSATSFAIQQILSFYTSDKSLMFESCLQHNYWPPETEGRTCLDSYFDTAAKKLVAAEATMNDKIYVALVEGRESAELVFKACWDAVTAARDALDADLSRCKNDVDRDSSGAVPLENKMRKFGRWKCRFVNGVFRCDF